MTRRDFQLIAGILRDTQAHPRQISRFADELAHTNPKFDRQRFIQASTAAALPEARV